MATSDDLAAFVKAGLERGIPRARLEEALRQAGWSVEQIKGGLRAFADVEFPIPVPRPRPSLSAREAFIYLVLFLTLYISAFNLGSLVFHLIDRAFPDPAARAAGAYTLQAIRWSISWIAVAFPVFLFMTSVVSRAIQRDPTKRESNIRRQLTYLTLFLASCALIADVTTLIYNFLGGELTVRFVLKVLTVAIIAGSTFGYYLIDLRADEREEARR